MTSGALFTSANISCQMNVFSTAEQIIPCILYANHILHSVTIEYGHSRFYLLEIFPLLCNVEYILESILINEVSG